MPDEKQTLRWRPLRELFGNRLIQVFSVLAVILALSTEGLNLYRTYLGALTDQQNLLKSEIDTCLARAKGSGLLERGDDTGFHQMTEIGDCGIGYNQHGLTKTATASPAAEVPSPGVVPSAKEVIAARHTMIQACAYLETNTAPTPAQSAACSTAINETKDLQLRQEKWWNLWGADTNEILWPYFKWGWAFFTLSLIAANVRNARDYRREEQQSGYWHHAPAKTFIFGIDKFMNDNWPWAIALVVKTLYWSWITVSVIWITGMYTHHLGELAEAAQKLRNQ